MRHMYTLVRIKNEAGNHTRRKKIDNENVLQSDLRENQERLQQVRDESILSSDDR